MSVSQELQSWSEPVPVFINAYKKKDCRNFDSLFLMGNTSIIVFWLTYSKSHDNISFVVQGM